MAKLNMSPPWELFYRRVNALFKRDPYVHVIYDNDENVIKIFAEDSKKAEALTEIMPESKTFGNVTTKIEVIPANSGRNLAYGENDNLLEIAFAGNDMVSFVEKVQFFAGGEVTYVVFKNEVIQYFSDNIGDYYGVTSTLAQDIAKEVFADMAGVYFCTNLPSGPSLGMPIGQWP